MAFVGRRDELTALGAALERAAAGEGQVALISGESGIGKTSLLRAFADRAAGMGFRVLWANCSEEPGAPPLWPWGQLLQALTGEDRSTSRRRDDDTDNRAILDRLTPAVEKYPALAASAEDDRSQFRLFRDILTFWRKASQRQRLVLIIDDLHRDPGTSSTLFEIVAEGLGDAHLMLAAAFREEAAYGHGRLPAMLGSLIRHDHVIRIALHGLEPSETAHLLTVITGADVPPKLAALLTQRADGNPLFIQELGRELVKGGQLQLDDSTVPGLPDSIRLLFENRVGRLSSSCRAIMEVASVIGRRFDQGLLGDALTLDDADSATTALEEALSNRLLVALRDLGHYQFSHALLRDTIYESIPAPRRVDLHHRIGMALEQRYGAGLDPPFERLAFHFAQSAMAGGAAKALDYLTRAAQKAETMHAPEEAADFYSEAIRLDREFLAGTNSPVLLMPLGNAEIQSGRDEAACRTMLEAAAYARHVGDASMLARAALRYETASKRSTAAGLEAVALLEEAVASNQSADGKVLSAVESALCRANILAGRPDEALAAYQRAFEAAKDLKDERALFHPLYAITTARLSPEILQVRLAAGRQAFEIARRAPHFESEMGNLASWHFADLIEAGNFDEAQAVAGAAAASIDRIGDRFLQLITQHMKLIIAMQSAADSSVERVIESVYRAGLRFNPDNASGVYGIQMFTLRREQGRLADLKPVLERFLTERDPTAIWSPALALLYCDLRMLTDARHVFEQYSGGGFDHIPRDGRWPITITYLAEVCATIRNKERAPQLYKLLEPYSGHNIVTQTVCLGAADRYLGMLCATTADWTTAEKHFEAALMLCGAAMPIWQAHTQFHFARMLLDRGDEGDRGRAKELTKSAHTIAMKLGLDRLRDDCRTLQARGGGPPLPDGLSRGELRVLRLLASGATNKAIAESLFLSPHTVANHVRNILAKTGSANRTEAANYARRTGLADSVNHELTS